MTPPTTPARAFAEELGKTVIESKDIPGFLVNRMLGPFINEAVFALMESTGTAEDIDTGARLGLNHPMGPLELSDFIGNDVMLNVMDVLLPRLRRPEVPRGAAPAPDGHGRPPRPEDGARLLRLRREREEDRLMARRDGAGPRPVRSQRGGARRPRHGPRLGAARGRARGRAARRGGALRPAPLRARRRARHHRACRIPRSYGGAGMGTFAWALALEEIAAADMAMAVSLIGPRPQPAVHLRQRHR